MLTHLFFTIVYPIYRAYEAQLAAVGEVILRAIS